MSLNHPETIFPPPPQSMEKLSSTKQVPSAKKDWTAALNDMRVTGLIENTLQKVIVQLALP